MLKKLFIIGILCLAAACMSVREGEETQGEGEYPQACSYCHGASVNPAPPPNLEGESGTSARGVGAHQIHLTSTNADIDCSDCHTVPEDVTDDGHVDSDPPAEVTFGSRAQTGGPQPSWDGTKCSNVYCHGASMEGGTNPEPEWDQAGTSTCSGCHGMPPLSGEYHVAGESSCTPCHPSLTPDGHVDGEVDFWQ